MPQQVGKRTAEGKSATEVILSVFRTNGLLLAAGDDLAVEFGLTSARWQVLGAIVYAERPLTVPQIARRMGLTRQSVHTTVNRLVTDGIVEFVANADHRRSRLVRLTDRGDATYRAIDQKQAAWVNGLVSGLSKSELDIAANLLGELCTRLEADPSDPNEQGGEER